MKRLALFLVLTLGVTACSGAQADRAAHVAIVTSGGIVAGLADANRTQFADATDALAARLSGAEYRAQFPAYEAAFRARAEEVQALDAQLYAGAAIRDAAHGDPTARAALARNILAALDRTVRSLSHGGLLPPLPIPPEVAAITGALRAIAGSP